MVGKAPVGVGLAAKVILEGTRAYFAWNWVPLHFPPTVSLLVKVDAAEHSFHMTQILLREHHVALKKR